MATRPRVKFYLVHLETGQRYPITNEEVRIGRTSGDILFPDDMKLSQQHCRLIITKTGLGVQDLGSANGTTLEGKSLSPEKIYVFKSGSKLTAGNQVFNLQAAGLTTKIRLRRRHVKPSDFSSQAVILIFGIAAALLISKLVTTRGSNHLVEPALPPMEAPSKMVDKELQTVLDQYRQLGQQAQGGQANQRQMAQSIRTSLLPAAQRVQVKLEVVKPQSEFERRKLEITRKMVTALIGQVSAMADFVETKNPKASQALRKFSDDLEALNHQAQVLKARSPAQADDGHFR